MNTIYQNQRPDFNTVSNTVQALEQRYPFMKVESIGQSHLHRDIFSLTIGNQKAENAVLLAGSFHALEWITCMLLLRLCEDICLSAESKKPLAGIDIAKGLSDKSVTFVPMVNPDGTELVLNGIDSAGLLYRKVAEIATNSLPGQGKNDELPVNFDFSPWQTRWQANANGVDINHNFDAGWNLLRKLEVSEGITSFASRQFGGYAPESEPETKTLCDLCRRIPFRHAMAFHSQGEEIYWHYGRHTPEKSKLMAQVLASSCGYTPAHPSGLASHGGFKDWFIEVFHRPAFTVEVGKGHNPLPIEDFLPIYTKIQEMMVLSIVI